MALEGIIISQENFEIMQPVMLVTRLFGILPVQYSKHGHQHYKLKKSLLYGVYSYLLCIALTGGTLLGIINDLQQDDAHSVRMRDRKSRYVTSCDISIVIIIVLFSTVTLPLKLKKFWKLLQCLNQMDSIIPLSKQKKIRRSSILFMTTTYVITILLFTFDIAVWTDSTTKRMSHATSFFKNYATFYVLYLIVVTQEMLFWHLIFFIKIRISGLNKNLRCVENENMDKLFKMTAQAYEAKMKIGQTAEGTSLEKIDSIQQDGPGRKTVERMRLIDKITALAKFQEKIFEAAQSVNNCSSYGIHLITLSCLLHLIVTPYFLLTELLKDDRNLPFISLQSLWLLAHVGRLLIIVEPCQVCLNEHHRTSILLCELLTRNFDENIKNSLIMFAMQLNYCKIRFTSCGFFRIDRSLLTSVAGAVTTYLVILFQFNS